MPMPDFPPQPSPGQSVSPGMTGGAQPQPVDPRANVAAVGMIKMGIQMLVRNNPGFLPEAMGFMQKVQEMSRPPSPPPTQVPPGAV